MKDKRITICPHCNEPMVWTFMIPYSEWYCLNCGHSCGCMNGKTIYATDELIIKQKMYKEIFKALYKNIMPHTAQRTDCKKCKELNQYHYKHATKKEILKDTIARKLLKSFVGKRKKN